MQLSSQRWSRQTIGGKTGGPPPGSAWTSDVGVAVLGSPPHSCIHFLAQPPNAGSGGTFLTPSLSSMKMGTPHLLEFLNLAQGLVHSWCFVSVGYGGRFWNSNQVWVFFVTTQIIL